jgi:hypothetical protein
VLQPRRAFFLYLMMRYVEWSFAMRHYPVAIFHQRLLAERR